MTNGYGNCIVLKYNNAKDVVVEFVADKYITTCRAGNLRIGAVKNPYAPFVYGVGFIGDITKYKPYENNKATKSYELWKSILNRCYNDRTQIKQPAYIGCVVCDEWHCFQTFSKWWYEQPNNTYIDCCGKSITIDKDLFSGNKRGKMYSPDICVLLPEEINHAMQEVMNKNSDLPTGVSKNSCGINYTSRLSKYGKSINLGTYESIDAAESSYQCAKKTYISELAEKYHFMLSDRIYNKLIEWE